jgi:hypothetical protein
MKELNLESRKKRNEKIVLGYLETKFENAYAHAPETFGHDSEEFAQKLRKRYPHFEKYRLYHLLAGSSAFKNCIEFDFPDEDSIEKFIIKESQKSDEEKKLREAEEGLFE